MRRRQVIALLGGSSAWPLVALGWPIVVRAQQSKPSVIGFLNAGTRAEFARSLNGFHQGLRETGYVEGRNVGMEYRWAEGHYDRLPTLAADLVRRQVDIIVATGGNHSALAANSATKTIPIVFTVGGDPVLLGLLASFNRPGGNITGVSLLLEQLVSKRLDVLLELVPKAKTVALLVNPNVRTSEVQAREAEDAARSRGIQLRVVRAGSEGEIDGAFARLAALRPDALIVASDPIFTNRRRQIVTKTVDLAVPAIFPLREFAAEGGLASYGASLPAAYRQAGIYAGRILKGARPADLPVLQPTNFELVINLKTAKALGLTVPDSVIVRADEVIE